MAEDATPDLPPTSIGSAGLQGRPQIVRIPDSYEEPDGYDEFGEPIWSTPRAAGKAIPPNCLRVLNSPLPHDRGGSCSDDCPGLQRDGSCLCDIVRTANAEGVDWKFEVDPRDNRWDYVGPPLQGAVLPVDPRPEPEPTEHEFTCPHCGESCVNAVGNWWCVSCGQNANDAPKLGRAAARTRREEYEALRAENPPLEGETGYEYDLRLRRLRGEEVFIQGIDGDLWVFGDEGSGAFIRMPMADLKNPNGSGRILDLLGIYFEDGKWRQRG